MIDVGSQGGESAFPLVNGGELSWLSATCGRERPEPDVRLRLLASSVLEYYT